MLVRDDDGSRRRGSSTTPPALGRRVRYVLDYDFADAPHAFSWSLVEGDMLRALDGRYAFDAAGDGTLRRLHLRVDLAVPLPGLIKRRASGMIMGTALRDLKRVVESDEAAIGRRAAVTRATRTDDAAPRRGRLRVGGHRGAPAPAAVGARERDHRAARRGARGARPRAAGRRRAARRGEGADRRRRPGGAPAARRRPDAWATSDAATFGVDLGGTQPAGRGRSIPTARSSSSDGCPTPDDARRHRRRHRRRGARVRAARGPEAPGARRRRRRAWSTTTA